MDSNARSIVKAVSYRVFGSLSTAGIFYALNRDLSLAFIGGSLDAVVKIGLYFLHERLWNKINYGRPKPPDYEI